MQQHLDFPLPTPQKITIAYLLKSSKHPFRRDCFLAHSYELVLASINQSNEE